MQHPKTIFPDSAIFIEGKRVANQRCLKKKWEGGGREGGREGKRWLSVMQAAILGFALRAKIIAFCHIPQYTYYTILHYTILKIID
jgi:hypothetical protein